MHMRQVLSILSFSPTLAHSRPHGDSFRINVVNNCSWTKEVGIYSVTPGFQMVSHGHTFNIPSGNEHTLHAPYLGVGLRLSGHAEWGLAGQWQPQLLFEFGYSVYDGLQGTAYDISMMAGSDPNVGMAVTVLPNGQGSETCSSKVCLPQDCPPDQGWTNPDQSLLGSPADAVCYRGKSDFRVVYCPEA